MPGRACGLAPPVLSLPPCGVVTQLPAYTPVPAASVCRKIDRALGGQPGPPLERWPPGVVAHRRSRALPELLDHQHQPVVDRAEGRGALALLPRVLLGQALALSGQLLDGEPDKQHQGRKWGGNGNRGGDAKKSKRGESSGAGAVAVAARRGTPSPSALTPSSCLPRWPLRLLSWKVQPSLSSGRASPLITCVPSRSGLSPPPSQLRPAARSLSRASAAA
jgi:hypothetical protein